MESVLSEIVKGKKVLFITTKNVDYIRNSQEIDILEKEAAQLKKVFSGKKNYAGRLMEIWGKLLICNRSDFDVVFAGFAPQLVFPFLKKFKGKKIIIDFFISVYDTLVNDRKIVTARNPVAKFFHWMDSYVIKKADLVVTDTKSDAAYFIQEFHGDQTKFETLYLKADRSIYYPREQRKEEKLKDKFVVLYFGSVLPLQGVDIVLKAVSLLKGKDNIYLQIIGPIPEKYHKPIQENVEYIDWLSQEKLAEYIANADLCLAGHFNRDIDKAQRTIPGKAYIYQSMQKVMICGDNRANRELFKEDSSVCFVPMGSAEKLRDAIDFICEQRYLGQIGA